MRIKKEKIHAVIRLLCESSGIRAIHRLTGLHQETVLKILELSGKIADQYQKDKIKNVKSEIVCADEIHTIVHSKDWGMKSKDPAKGSQYAFLAVDAKSKLIINSLVGQRSLENAVDFFKTVKERVANRFQLNTDAWTAYSGKIGRRSSIKTVFGSEIDHATEEKHFYKTGQFVSRSLAKTVRKARVGNPDLNRASTSFVERTNLTLRLFNRRFTRCTLGFSKKLINLRHSLSLFSWNFNFAWKHSTIKTTPAIASGIAFAIMTVVELWDYAGITI